MRRVTRDPDELEVERVGLGYIGTRVASGVSLSIDRLVQQRGELMGELTVERAPEGHVFIGRFNVSSLSSRRQTAEWLGKRTNSVDWADALERFCLHVLRAEREGQPFTTVGTEEPAEEIPFLLWPLLPAGRPTIIYGEGGVGKSTLAAAAAVTVQTGTPVMKGWRISARANVLVVDWEADSAEWNDLVASIARGIGLPQPEVHYRAGAGPLTDQLHEVAQHVTQHEIGLLIIDSVGLAMPSRTEGAGAEEGAMRLFGALRQLGVTTLLVDHVAGADMGVERAIAKPYGSVYKFNLARNLFELRGMPPTADGVMHLGLFHRKSNRTAKLDPIGIAVHHGPGEVLFTGEDLEAAEANVAIPLHSRIHALLLAGGKTPTQLSDALNTSPRTIRTTLNRMRSIGMAAPLKAKVGRENVWAAMTLRDDSPTIQAQHETQHVTHEPSSPQTPVEDDLWG